MDDEAVQRWLIRPHEGLDYELKSWIDPTQPADRASIVKAVMALRNRDGGMLAIGFDDNTCEPIPTERLDWRTIYHHDTIQALVSKHSSQPFSVSVEWFQSNVAQHPVILVARGVRTPVAIKSPVQVSGRDVLPVGIVYFRTLSANGTPSSAPARPLDWEEIMRLCFDNREADIGRFVRRHLSLASIPGVLAALGIPQADETLRGQTLALLDEGERYFQSVIAETKPQPGHEDAVMWGYGEIALIISPAPDGEKTPTNSFLNSLFAARSTRRGIPPWHDGRHLRGRDTQPFTCEGALQLLLDVPGDFPAFFEFSRFDPRGRFYCRSTFREDLQKLESEGMRTLDPAKVVERVTEAFLTGADFARAMGADSECSLGFAFRWRGLKGRKLHNWDRARDYLRRLNVARGDDVIVTFVELPIMTPPSALAQYALQVASPVTEAFGLELPISFVERVVAEVMGSAAF